MVLCLLKGGMMPGKKKGGKGKEAMTCNAGRHDGKPCGRDLYDDEHCIFHSKDIDGKKDKFNDDFKKEFKSQKEREGPFDFSGFVFPGDIPFAGKVFEKVAYFRGSQFSGMADFIGAKFSGTADFKLAKFSGKADFREAQFFGVADFIGAKFSGTAYFRGAQFSGMADFRGAKFSGMANFGGAQFSGANFFGAKFWEANFRGAQFSGVAYFIATFSGEADFKLAKFSGVAYFEEAQFSKKADFWGAKFSGMADFVKAQFFGEAVFWNAEFHGKSIFKNVYFKDFGQCNMINTYFYNVAGFLEYLAENKKKFKHPRGIKYLHDNCKPILGEATVSRLPILSREVRDDVYLLSFKEKHPKMHFMWWLSADCGRSFSRWALWSLILAEVFAIIFGICYGCKPLSFKSEVISFSWPGISLLYYSIVTFTTLGFGDIVPEIPKLQIIVMLEVILGYIMLGGLISIFANKLARRS
jgi:uncharacterized protein YjbI with pentapeptide repeats